MTNSLIFKKTESLMNVNRKHSNMKFILTFDANGGICTIITKEYIFPVEKYESLPIPTREGYKFTGWYTEREHNSGERVTTASQALISITTLYAHWIEYVINLDGATINDTDSSYSSDNNSVSIYQTLAIARKPNYFFTGWYKEQSHGANTIKINSSSTIDDSIEKIYAHWVELDVQDGTFPDSTTTYYSTDESYYSTLPIPTKSNYKFLGWYTKLNDGTKIRSNKYSNIDDSIEKLYAYWLYFDTNGGTLYTTTLTDSSVNTTTKYVSLPYCNERTNYQFLGWFTEDSGTRVIPINIILLNQTTLYAHWLYFDVNGGSDVLPSMSATPFSVRHYSTLPYSEKSGNKFLGWFTSGGGKITTFKLISPSSLTAYARWLTFDSTGGSEITSSVDAASNSSSVYGTLPYPTLAGSKFLGWYTAKTNGSKILSSSKISNENGTPTTTTTAYARWLTFDSTGGSEITSSVDAASNSSSVYGTLPYPTLAGSKFLGWYGNNGVSFHMEIPSLSSTKLQGIYYSKDKNIWLVGSINNEGIYYSEDGKTWTQSNKTDGYFKKFCYSKIKNIFVGIGCSLNGDTLGIWYSEDGKTWTQSNKTDGYFTDITFSESIGLFIVGSNYNNTTGIWYSEDGKTWTQSNKTDSYIEVITDITNKNLILIGTRSGIWYSEDGKTWTQSNKTDGYFSVIYYEKSKNIILASSTNSSYGIGIWYSEDDGKTWTQSNKANYCYYSIVYSKYNNLFVAGSNFLTVYSEDGKTWTDISNTNQILQKIIYIKDPTMFIGISQKGFFYSIDGKKWIIDISSSITDFDYDENKNIVYIGSNGLRYLTIINSKKLESDGISECAISTTVSAKWVAFDSNGGEVVTTVEPSLNTDKLYNTMPSTVYPNYKLVGWYTDNTDFETVKLSSNEVDANMKTLYAKWLLKQKVTFHTDKGTLSKTEELFAKGYTYGEFGLAMVEIDDGTNFFSKAWYKSADLTGDIIDENSIFDGNVTDLYAKFHTKLNVSFDANGGTCTSSSITMIPNTLYSTEGLPTPTRSNYIFAGWYVGSPSSTEKIGIDSYSEKYDENITVYAKWLAISSSSYSYLDLLNAKCNALTKKDTIQFSLSSTSTYKYEIGKNTEFYYNSSERFSVAFPINKVCNEGYTKALHISSSCKGDLSFYWRGDNTVNYGSYYYPYCDYLYYKRNSLATTGIVMNSYGGNMIDYRALNINLPNEDSNICDIYVHRKYSSYSYSYYAYRLLLSYFNWAPSNIPPPRTILDYIENSNGTEYIDTGIKPTNNTKFELRYMAPSGRTTEWSVFFGSAVSDDTRNGAIWRYSNSTTTLNAWYNTSGNVWQEPVITVPLSANSFIHTVSIEKGKCIFDGTEYKINSLDNFSSTKSVYLFGANCSSYNQYGAGRCQKFRAYEFKVWNKEELIMDLIPCKYILNSNIPCMYDKVGKKYYLNKGRGTFGFELD